MTGDDAEYFGMTEGMKVFFKKTGKVLEIKVVLLYINGTCRDGGIGRHKGLKIPRQLNDVPVRLRFSAVGCSFEQPFFFL